MLLSNQNSVLAHPLAIESTHEYASFDTFFLEHHTHTHSLSLAYRRTAIYKETLPSSLAWGGRLSRIRFFVGDLIQLPSSKNHVIILLFTLLLSRFTAFSGRRCISIVILRSLSIWMDLSFYFYFLNLLVDLLKSNCLYGYRITEKARTKLIDLWLLCLV